VRLSRIACLAGVLAVSASMVLTPAASAEPVPSAPTPPCPDVEIIFARGTTEAPGVGGVGQAFVDAVKSRAGQTSVATYALTIPRAPTGPRPRKA
jgi:cutinase